MAGDARIGGGNRPPDRWRFRALGLPARMTMKAFFAKEVTCRTLRGGGVTAVTCDAAELTVRLPITATGIHLFDLADGRRLISLAPRRFQEDDPVFAQGHSGLEIEFGSA